MKCSRSTRNYMHTKHYLNLLTTTAGGGSLMTENNWAILPKRQEQHLNWHPENTKPRLSGEEVVFCSTSGMGAAIK
jgi:hypothetical protein